MGEKTSSEGRELIRAGFVNAGGSNEAEDLTEIAGAIKWFDVAKGYGFILPGEAAQ